MKIFAIELTNWCNAKCSFCPYPTPAHTREKGWMTRTTLMKIIEYADPPLEINLSGLGEPTLHRDLVEYVHILTMSGLRVQMNTNGQQLTQRMYDQLAQVGLDRIVLTSDYFPWDKGRLKTQDQLPITFFTITRDPDHPELGQVRKPLDDWGKQIGNVDRPKVRCSFLHDDFVQICWDGTVQRCCCDFNAEHTLGNVFDDTFHQRYERGEFTSVEIPLCGPCSGFVFQNGIVAGNYDGMDRVEAPAAFVQLENLSVSDNPTDRV